MHLCLGALEAIVPPSLFRCPNMAFSWIFQQHVHTTLGQTREHKRIEAWPGSTKTPGSKTRAVVSMPRGSEGEGQTGPSDAVSKMLKEMLSD